MEHPIASTWGSTPPKSGKWSITINMSDSDDVYFRAIDEKHQPLISVVMPAEGILQLTGLTTSKEPSLKGKSVS